VLQNDSWYFGPISRRGAEDLLNQEEIGVFLVRNSTTSQGDLVLCVREDEKVSHYIIHKVPAAEFPKWMNILPCGLL
jgi:hypothetical protein